MVQRKARPSNSITVQENLQTKKNVNEIFSRDIFPSSSKTFSTSATSYGKGNENSAKRKYLSYLERHIHDCGLLISYIPQFPILFHSLPYTKCWWKYWIKEDKWIFFSDTGTNDGLRGVFLFKTLKRIRCSKLKCFRS